MITFNPNPHKLQVTPSAKEPGRFDWSITCNGVVVRQSVRSFGSEGASEANGDAAFREVTSRWQKARSEPLVATRVEPAPSRSRSVQGVRMRL